MKQILDIFRHFQDYILFTGILLFGLFFKIYNAQQIGKKLTFSYVLAEAITYAFVGFSAHVILNQFFDFSAVFNCIITAWIGGKSTIINVEVEKLLLTAFKKLNETIKTK